jgi:chromosome segregation ATPase
MAKALVTQGAVFEVADVLLAAGEEPSIIAVQERIGGGSYSTVKRYLDDWKVQRQVTQQQAMEVPEEIVTRGNEFMRRLWAVATTLAEQSVAQLRDDAQRQVADARAALATAETAIVRLESDNDVQAQQLSEQQQRLAQLVEDLTQARSVAQIAQARADEQAQRVRDLQRELDLAHQQIAQLTEEIRQARTATLEQARQEGELAALRQQLQDQAALIDRLTQKD